MCIYRSRYYDFQREGHFTFECMEKEKRNGFCIFHDPKYWQENPKEVVEGFRSKIKSAIKNHKELLCIGYNLPDISARRTSRYRSISLIPHSEEMQDFLRPSLEVRQTFKGVFSRRSQTSTRRNSQEKYTLAERNSTWQQIFVRQSLKERLGLRMRSSRRLDFPKQLLKRTLPLIAHYSTEG